MEILDNVDQWLAEFEAGWLAHYNETGERKWEIYNRPKNAAAPSGPAVDLADSRLVLITSAGSYLTDSQPPYDAANMLGDYSIRVYPSNTPLEKLSFAHDQYNHAAVESDQQVLVPLRNLEDLAAEGVIGELASNVISFHGYLPDAARFVRETVPMIVAAVKNEGAQAALLVPA